MFCPNAIVWDGVGTWIAGLATATTLLFGIYQWSRLRRDSIAEKAANVEEQRVEQARRVCAWLDALHGHGTLRLSNSSGELVTNVVVYYVWVQGAAWRTGEEAERHFRGFRDRGEGGDINVVRALVQTLPPGKFRVAIDGPDNSPMQGQLGLEIAFTDSAGRHWRRRADGGLAEIKNDPLSHYGVERPARFQLLLEW